ncbi:winged helix-turn-helix transcriptional regulator, partial [Escherichia coli]|nr:winged helix-turn-helix transcriptional regulator [Escherichia coli]
MREGPDIAAIASLVGDPARANMLQALMDGGALTATELAHEAGVTPPTASAHLSKLVNGGLLRVARQGRHRYYRLASPQVAGMVEAISGVAETLGPKRVRPGPKDAAMRQARVCYDHLAGEQGVALLDALLKRGVIEAGGGDLRLGGKGAGFFEAVGINLDDLKAKRRPLCRACLDWSERRSHLAGALGAAVLDVIVEKKWARRDAG